MRFKPFSTPSRYLSLAVASGGVLFHAPAQLRGSVKYRNRPCSIARSDSATDQVRSSAPISSSCRATSDMAVLSAPIRLASNEGWEQSGKQHKATIKAKAVSGRLVRIASQRAAMNSCSVIRTSSFLWTTRAIIHDNPYQQHGARRSFPAPKARQAFKRWEGVGRKFLHYLSAFCMNGVLMRPVRYLCPVIKEGRGCGFWVFPFFYPFSAPDPWYVASTPTRTTQMILNYCFYL